MPGIFSKNFFIYEELEVLVKTRVSQHIIFDEFIDSLKSLGVFVKYVSSVAQTDSRAVSKTSGQCEPCLKLYVSTHEAFVSLSVSEHDSNWNGSFPLTAEIQSLWTRCCVRNGINEKYFSPNMYVFIYNLGAHLLNRLIRACKKELINRLSIKIFDGYIPPKYVFVGSVPGVYVLYSTKREVDLIKKHGALLHLREVVFDVLKTNDLHDCFRHELVEINFFDVETYQGSLYGLSRED
ncbi:hypothetical protein [Ereboglobus luteus]|uniref:hypothetical protein n=1 Tax=Ereboglobus luteus TaxID=1796921 RepID=UPI001375165B|nr:hypothetical protein [Ereboglobus luteus]